MEVLKNDQIYLKIVTQVFLGSLITDYRERSLFYCIQVDGILATARCKLMRAAKLNSLDVKLGLCVKLVHALEVTTESFFRYSKYSCNFEYEFVNSIEIQLLWFIRTQFYIDF